MKSHHFFIRPEGPKERIAGGVRGCVAIGKIGDLNLHVFGDRVSYPPEDVKNGGYYGIPTARSLSGSIVSTYCG